MLFLWTIKRCLLSEKPSLHVKWLKRALLDLDDVEAYISQTDPLAKEQPGLGRAGRVPGTRELVIPNTRYIVPYRVKDDFLQILRVYHSSRIWPRRL